MQTLSRRKRVVRSEFRCALACQCPPIRSSHWLQLLTMMWVLSWAASGQAETRLPETLEEYALTPDAIVLASVKRISQREKDGEKLVDVSLEDIEIVTSRLRGERFREFTVASELHQSHQQAPVVSFEHGSLRQGTRYLFFFRGGEWSQAPFVREPLPVDVTGVQCGGQAYVFGFGSMGPVCGGLAHFAGQPLTERELVATLQTVRLRAGRRYTQWAQTLEQHVQTLQRSPRGHID